jgi:tetratricopeptide (TPR) repeat protein
MAGSRPLDDPRADDELERALALAIDSPLASTILNNLATRSIATGDLQRADELYAEAMRVAERFGDRVSVRWLRVSEIFMDFFLGRWDDAMRSADEFIAECEAGIQSYREPMAREFRGFIRLARDDVDGALDDHRRALALSRETKDPQTFVPSLASCAGTLAAVGESKELHTVLDELLPIAERHPEYAVGPLGPLALMSGIADLEDDFRRIIEAAPTGPWKEAAIAGLDRDFDRAARTYVETGTLPWEAQARLRAAEQLIEAGREAEGQVELQKALAFYRSVGATFYLRRGEALLAKTG